MRIVLPPFGRDGGVPLLTYAFQHVVARASGRPRLVERAWQPSSSACLVPPRSGAALVPSAPGTHAKCGSGAFTMTANDEQMKFVHREFFLRREADVRSRDSSTRSNG